MNEDTIFLNARGDEIPRVKRIRREGPTQGGLTSFRFKPYQIPTNTPKDPEDGGKRLSKQPENVEQITVENGDAQQTNIDESGEGDIMEQRPTNGVEANGDPAIVNAAKTSARARRPTAKGFLFKAYNPPNSSQTPKRKLTARPQSPEPEALPQTLPRHSYRLRPNRSELPEQSKIKFSTAPEDPVELAWWLVHQISHFETVVIQSGEPMRVMEKPPPPDPSVRTTKESARKRQQKWRANHRERSKLMPSTRNEPCVADLGASETLNDLRSRLNREAKQKFGPTSSAKKSAWIEAEFLKRRNKLEMKQRLLASQAGAYPELKVAREVRDFMIAKDSTLSRKGQQIRTLVVDLLFPKHGNKSMKVLRRTAKAFLAAVDDSEPGKNEILSAVLKGIAETSEAMKAIKAEVATDEIGVDEIFVSKSVAPSRLQTDATSQATSPKSPANLPVATTVTTRASSEDNEAETGKMMKAINDAVAILAQINDAKAKPSSQNNARQERNSQTKRVKQPQAGIDLDAFLVTANAGPLSGMPNENDQVKAGNDDETIPDADDEEDQDASNSVGDSPDSAVWSSINQLINQLVSKRLEFDAKTRNKNGFNAQGQAQKARKFLENANLRANFAMTKANSEAISYLYTQLVGLLSSETQLPEELAVGDDDLGDTNNGPEPATSIPDKRAPTKEPIPRMRSPPPPPPPKSLPPLSAKYNPPLSSPSQQSGVRTEEEQRKIRSYGFPPLPGRKIGTPRN